MSTKRLPAAERRAQIVEATLALLAETPLQHVTTRQIAQAVGLSQPALFRHFDSRDAILAAVVERTRGVLEQVAEQVVSAPAPLDGLRLLVQGLFAHVQQHPGLPRLLFHDIAGVGADYHAGLVHLVDLQRALVGELIRSAQRLGHAPQEVDPAAAARLLVALVQGVLLQRQLLADPLASLTEEAERLLDLFLAALAAGEPHGAPEPSQPAAPPRAIVALDVRPILAAGTDPLEAILAALVGLAPDGVLKLTAPFRPKPLLALLGGRGYRVSAREGAPGEWHVEALAADAPEPVDLRGLPAPEPLEQVLIASFELAPGQAYLARVPRIPRLLLGRLDERGLPWEVHEEPDSSALLHIRGKP